AQPRHDRGGKGRIMRRPLLSSALTLGLLVAGIAHAATGVYIESPAEGAPVFGQTEVRVQVNGDEPVTQVELFVNGKLMGTLTKAPYAFRFDAGDENIKREFRIVARSEE